MLNGLILYHPCGLRMSTHNTQHWHPMPNLTKSMRGMGVHPPAQQMKIKIYLDYHCLYAQQLNQYGNATDHSIYRYLLGDRHMQLFARCWKK